MDTVTYSTDAVVNFIRDQIVPIRISAGEEWFYDKFSAIWTPMFFILDYRGNDIQRTMGFLSPDEFIAFAKLGIAKVRFSNDEYDTANVHLNRIFEHFPDSDVIPETIYFQGVVRYKEKNDPNQLKAAYETLLDRFPNSGWTKRLEPYRLI